MVGSQPDDLLGPRRKVADVEVNVEVIKATQTTNQTRLLVRTRGPILDPAWDVSEVGLEDIILAYMGQDEELNAGPLAMMGSGR